MASVWSQVTAGLANSGFRPPRAAGATSPHTKAGMVGLSRSSFSALLSLGASQFPNRASWSLAHGYQGTVLSTCHREMNVKLSPKGKKYAADIDTLWLLQSKCVWLSSSHHLTQPSKYLFIYLFHCPWERSPMGEVSAEPFQEFSQWERF